MIVHESLHREVRDRLAEAVSSLSMGAPFDHLDDMAHGDSGDRETGWAGSEGAVGAGASQGRRAHDIGPVISLA